MRQDEIDTLSRLREGEKAADTTGVERWSNLVEMFFAQAERCQESPFLWSRSGDGWQALSWGDAALQVAQLAAGLRVAGLKAGERVVIVSENRPEFCLADLAIMAAGGISVPTYTTNGVAEHLHVLRDSSAAMAIVSTGKLARPLLGAMREGGECRLLVSMEPLAGVEEVRLLSWADLHEGSATVAAARRAATMRRPDLACLIYTSGTGGVPRGVMQHHGAILHNLGGCIDIIANDFASGGRERFLSFLPLSHAYEHTAGQFLPIALGGEIFYCPSLENLASSIEDVRPTIMIVVPRLFEVLRGRMLKAIREQGSLARWLLARNTALHDVRRRKGRLPLYLKPLDALLEKTLRRKIRLRLGGRLKAMVSGGAPLFPEVGHFFLSMGVPLLQGYGQTEAGPVVSCNRPAAGIKVETVGPPLRDTEVRIAEDGEIMISGELVMQGYWRREEESARVLRGGWLHTGDIGHIDPDGHIVITDRKKDIIINDKGENIAPQRVEGLLTLQPEIMQAMIYGDRKPWIVGVIVPDPDFAAEWAMQQNMAPERLWQDPGFHAALALAVGRVNGKLTVTEKVRRFVVAEAPFSTDNGELTPSMKIRRHVILEHYGARLAALYGAASGKGGSDGMIDGSPTTRKGGLLKDG